MTLAAAWVREAGAHEELVIATDSRLRGGYAWDCAPKILPLPRSDSAIYFAGSTDFAYPMMLQMANAISMFPASRNRGLDIHHMKGHTLRLFNSLLEKFSDFPGKTDKPDDPDTVFLLGGYSWEKKRFAIWTLHFNSHDEKFTFRPAKPWKGQKGGKKLMTFAGNHVDEAKERLIRILRKKQKLTVSGFDYEPFEVLRDMARDKKYPQIGGAPQMVKIYEYLNTVTAGIYWPDRQSEKISVLGRDLLDYEKCSFPVFDPDRLAFDSGAGEEP